MRINSFGFHNIRSVRRKKQELINFIQQEDIDCMALCETFLSPESVLNIPNYVTVRLDRNNRGGGIAILVKNNLRIDIKHQTNNDTKFQALIVKIENIDVAIVYNPPNNVINENMMEEVVESLESPFIIMGDFNAKHEFWGCRQNNRNGNFLCNYAQYRNWVLMNNDEATRIGSNDQNNSTLDLCFLSTDIALRYNFSVLHETLNSDHLIIKLMDVENNNSNMLMDNSLTSCRYNTRRADWEKFETTISDILESSEINNINEYIKVITKAASQSIPKSKVSYNLKRKPAIWWDQECDKNIKLRKNITKKFLENCTVENWNHLQAIKRKTKRALQRKKKESFNNFINSLNKDTPSSTIWSKLKRFSTGFQQTNNPKNVEENFCERYLDYLCPQMVANISKIEYDINSIEFFTLEEFNFALRNISSSAPGIDKITNDMMWHQPEIAKTAALNIFNKFLINNKIPMELKKTIICPILKPGKPANAMKSFRPISLQSCVLKVLDRMITNRLNWNLENSNNFGSHQFGFRGGKGISEAITNLIAHLYALLYNKKESIIIFIDIEGAYDNVEIPILINLLLTADIPSYLVAIIDNIIRERIIVCKGDSKYINKRISRRGLPQGSPMSPVLFNLYFSKINNEIDGEFFTYADDIAVVFSAESRPSLVEKTNRELNKLNKKIEDLGLTISKEKTKAMLITRKRNKQIIPIVLDNNRVEYVRDYRYLGVRLKDSLNFTTFAQEQANKADKKLNIIRAIGGIKMGSHPSIMLMAYKAIVRSQMDFGIFLLNENNNRHWEKYESIQARAAKYSLGLMASAPNNFANFEAGLPPIKLRSKYLTNRMAAKQIQILNHETEDSLSEIANNMTGQKYWAKKKIPNILKYYLINKNKFKIKIENKPQIYISSYAAQISKKDVFLDWFPNTKTINEVKEGFEEIRRERGKDRTEFYTDGSVDTTLGRTGYSVYCPDLAIEKKCRLPIHCTVFLSEAIAISEALTMIVNLNINRSIIYSDSQSVLQAIKNPSLKTSEYAIITNIKEQLKQCRELNLSVHVVWVPGHMGIGGNEYADGLARRAGNHPNINEITMDWRVYNQVFKKELYEDWQKEWQTSTKKKAIIIGGIQPRIQKKTWFELYKITNREFITFCSRIRSGHIPTPEFLFKIGKKEDPLCECGQKGDLDHLFFQCQLARVHTDKLLSKLVKLNVPLPTRTTCLLGIPPTKNLKALFDFCGERNLKI